MKKMRRIISALLAAMMVMGLAMTASAATITINNTQDPPLTYQAYQVIKGDVTTVTENNVTKKTFANVSWGTGINSTTFLTEVKNITAFASVTDAESFVKVLSKQTNDSAVMQALANAVNKSLSTTVAGTSTQTQSPYTINVAESGYYFVKDTSGLAAADGRDSKYALVVVDDAATISIKTKVPGHDKKVLENQGHNYTATKVERETWGEGFNDVADYNIGDTVPFELVAPIPNFKGADSYYFEFVDEMSAGFTGPADVVVSIRDKDNIETLKRTLKEGTDYTLGNISFVPGLPTTFNIVIEDLVKTLTEDEIGHKLVVRFNAKLNPYAEVGNPGNINKSKIRYGNKPGVDGGPKESPWEDAIVFTYKLDADKFDSEDTQKKLMDAEFVFYRINANGAKEFVVLENYGTGSPSLTIDDIVTTWVVIADPPAGTTDLSAYYAGKGATILKTDANGQFAVVGLDEGTYYLKETKAPTGYNMLKKDIKAVLTASTNNGHNGTAGALTASTIDIDEQGAHHTENYPVGHENVPIAEPPGVELPETGGIGTTIFYVIGAMLMIGAGVVLVTRRRMSK